jgi:hypothetical protein
MFDFEATLSPNVLLPSKRLSMVPSDVAKHPGEESDRRAHGQSLLEPLEVPEPLDASWDLQELARFVTTRLPWVSRATGEPAGMWVDEVGLVDNRFELFPPGTPFVWIAVASWEAAEAVCEALHSIGRIDSSRWIGGWLCSGTVRRIKIYPEVPRQL